MELCRRYRCKVAVIPDHDLDLRFALLLQRSRAKAPVSEETGQHLREIAAGAELALSAGAKGGAPLGQKLCENRTYYSYHGTLPLWAQEQKKEKRKL